MILILTSSQRDIQIPQLDISGPSGICSSYCPSLGTLLSPPHSQALLPSQKEPLPLPRHQAPSSLWLSEPAAPVFLPFSFLDLTAVCVVVCSTSYFSALLAPPAFFTPWERDLPIPVSASSSVRHLRMVSISTLPRSGSGPSRGTPAMTGAAGRKAQGWQMLANLEAAGSGRGWAEATAFEPEGAGWKPWKGRTS